MWDFERRRENGSNLARLEIASELKQILTLTTSQADAKALEAPGEN